MHNYPVVMQELLIIQFTLTIAIGKSIRISPIVSRNDNHSTGWMMVQTGRWQEARRIVFWDGRSNLL